MRDESVVCEGGKENLKTTGAPRGEGCSEAPATVLRPWYGDKILVLSSFPYCCAIYVGWLGFHLCSLESRVLR